MAPKPNTAALAQQAFETEKHRYWELFEFAPEAFLVTDTRGVILEANRAAGDLLQTAPAALASRDLFSFVSPANHSTLQNLLKAVLDDRDVHAEVWLERPPAPPFPVSAGIMALHDSAGNRVGLRWWLRDVAQNLAVRRERDRLQDQVYRQGVELTETVASIADGVIIYDTSGAMVRLNPAAEAMLGYTPQPPGMPPDGHLPQVSIEKPEGGPFAPHDLPLARALRGETVQSVLIALRREASRLWALASAAPLHGADGRISGAVVTLTDVSEEQQDRQRLQEANEALESQANEMRAQNQALEAITADLEAERARLNAVIENAPEGILVADQTGRILLANPAAARIYKPPFPLEGNAQASYQLCRPDGTPCKPEELPLARSALYGENHSNVEMIILWPEGQHRDLLVSSAPIRDGQGRLTGAVSVFQDVSANRAADHERQWLLQQVQTYAGQVEARNAELEHLMQAREAEQARLRAILDTLPVGVAVVNAEGRLVQVNGMLARIWGDTLSNSSLSQEGVDRPGWFDPGDPALRKALLRGETTLGETLDIERLDGERATLLRSVAPIRDAQRSIEGAVIVAQDITRHHQVEEALRQRSRDLALLNGVSQTLTATLDAQQVIERLMQATLETIGTESGSVWLMDPEGAAIVCQTAWPPDLGAILTGARLALEQGVIGWVARHGETALLMHAREDARFYPGLDDIIGWQTESMLAVPLRVRNSIIGVLVLVNKLNSEFDRHDASLAETLAAAAAIAFENARLVESLRSQALELQARNEELDAFAHTVAHDLRAPLAPIVGYAEVFMSDQGDLSQKEMEHAAQIISENGRKMGDIIDALLLLSSVREAEVRAEPLNMRAVVDSVLRRLAFTAQKSGAEIVLPPAWPLSMGYAAWVEEVWANYISNAIKYGGRPPRVELGADKQPDGQVRFWVRDNGPGLTPEQQAQLFRPFTRLNTIHVKGHGLGLSIVLRIVRKLGGRVSVESEGVPGRGSIFSFTLPAAPDIPFED